MAFATRTDVENRWRGLTEDEGVRADALLEDASVTLASEVDVDPADQEQAKALRAVCCNMVIRSLVASEQGSLGIEQGTMTAGPYTKSWRYSNPGGEMYVTRAEKKLLGIGRSVGRVLAPSYGPAEE
jgi:hypothetical protein